MLKHFNEHPNSIGETYFEHLGSAASFSIRMFLASIACMVHALLPFLCVKTGSKVIGDLHDEMIVNRDRQRGNLLTINH